MGQKLGHRVFIVIEQMSEVECCSASPWRWASAHRRRAHQARLRGIRTLGQTGGEKIEVRRERGELMKVIDRLREADTLDFLKLIHFHLGSQITDIRYIKTRAAGTRALLRGAARRGRDITHVDVGGGLGIDYDGSGST